MNHLELNGNIDPGRCLSKTSYSSHAFVKYNQAQKGSMDPSILFADRLNTDPLSNFKYYDQPLKNKFKGCRDISIYFRNQPLAAL